MTPATLSRVSEKREPVLPTAVRVTEQIGTGKAVNWQAEVNTGYKRPEATRETELAARAYPPGPNG